MKFAYIDKTEFEADVIADILGSEDITFKTYVNRKCIPLFLGIAQLELFDIKFNTDYQKYLFVDKLIQDKLNNYKKLEKCFNLPVYDKFEIVEPSTTLGQALKELEDAQKEFTLAFKKKYKPKETLLYKLIKWINNGIFKQKNI